MGHGYTTISWTPYKKKYDLILAGLIIAYIVSFVLFHIFLHPEITAETMIIRATGSLAFILLHVILIIGPLARLNNRFLPLLYNRRHLGVATFLVALVHGVFNLIQFHALGNTNILNSLFTSNTQYGSLVNFPFQSLGFLTLLIMALLAFTSHDFWLKYLGPRLWKGLHMLVYLAYLSLIGHVLLGIVQLEDHPFFVYATLFGILSVCGLHLLSAFKRRDIDATTNENWIDAFSVSDIENDRAKILDINGESIAIFKYDGKLSAVKNQCSHQHGPLGEGKIIDGCITCPWHGFQYNPHNGQSPPPFEEKVCTYNIKVQDGRIWVNPNPLKPGTEVTPINI